jgi:hypothetical protein
MKYIASLICLLLISIATPALALQGSECSAKSAKLKPAERDSFMKSCLAQAEDPANVREEERKHKIAVCEQNAKNKKLQGNDKANYHENCMNKNEAATVASAQPKSTSTPSHKSASSNTPKSAPHKAAKKQKSGKKNVKKSTQPSAENKGL